MWQSSLFHSYDTSIIKNSENQSKPASYNSRHIITTHAEIRVLDERCDKMKNGNVTYVTIQNPIRKTALSELSFCSCGYFAKEIFKIMLIHASMIRKFMKIALALNSYIFVSPSPAHTT